MERRGRRTVWSLAAATVVVLGGTGWAFRERIAEEWWIWRLRSPDPQVRDGAIGKLAGMGSLRAVPALLRILPEMTRKLTFMSLPDRPYVDLRAEPPWNRAYRTLVEMPGAPARIVAEVRRIEAAGAARQEDLAILRAAAFHASLLERVRAGDASAVRLRDAIGLGRGPDDPEEDSTIAWDAHGVRAGERAFRVILVGSPSTIAEPPEVIRRRNVTAIALDEDFRLILWIDRSGIRYREARLEPAGEEARARAIGGAEAFKAALETADDPGVRRALEEALEEARRIYYGF